MKYGYIDKIDSVKEFQSYAQLFERSGVYLDNVVMNVNFEEFLDSLKTGDTIVVCSYVGLFPSVSAYLMKAIGMLKRGVVIESLQEPSVVINASNSEFANELNKLSHCLRSTLSLKSMHKLMNEGKMVGRPRGSSEELQKKVEQVDQLRKESNITVVAACKMVDCNLKTYYRLRNK